MNVRRTGGRAEFDKLIKAINATHARGSFSARTTGAIANGTTAGKFKTLAICVYAIGGVLYSKAITDDLWTLSAQTAVAASRFRAFYLFLDAAGTPSIAAGTDQTSASLALANLASTAIPSTQSVIGVFVAGASTDFTLALSAQGTLYNGLPDIAQTETTGTTVESILPLVSVAS
jgi:hypothetical protein